MSDLNEIFSRLKPQRQDVPQNESESKISNIWEAGTQRSTSAQHVTTRPDIGHRQLSANTPTTQNAVEQNMSNNLLNLLNINRTQPATPLAAASKPTDQSLPSRLTAGTPEAANNAGPPPDTQRFLLDLLIKPKTASQPSETPNPPTPDLSISDPASIEKLAQSFAIKSPQNASRTSTPNEHARTPSTATVLQHPASPAAKAGMFAYKNPFDALHASSPLNKPTTPVAQSVPQKLENLGETVNRQVKEALAQIPSPNLDKGDIESNWSTAEDEDSKKEQEEMVEVMNFPLRPFVLLEIKDSLVSRSFRKSTIDNATPVARLKKDFSHDDRTLATASRHHILYAVAPTDKKPASGLKVIRQDDGKNKHVWADVKERLCSVQLSQGQQGETEIVLATGVNGTIFYTILMSSISDDSFDEVNLEAQGFVMTPPPNADEASTASTFGTSSAIRTRAKLSNSPSAPFFAVARGRQIHLISPAVIQLGYTDSKNRRVETDRYLSDHSVSINTGKAGKDFVFSEDDTVLVSLDKVNKVKFWDLRQLWNDPGNKQEVKDEMFSFVAGTSLQSNDKTSPSSVTFLDKERAFTKRLALRYVLIGYQQNHILQLWDIGLGRCVQELRLPESATSEEQAKGLCSLVYHPKSAIIAIGHPGRNSVFFVHLSAPKYNLPTMDQATFISYVAAGDTKKVPRPDSTAIMSGIREFSCNSIGQLRSLDILQTPFGAESDDDAIFELYIMHSKGVIGVPIGRADLGWDSRGKVIKPVDAVEKGVVKLSELKLHMTNDEKAVSKEEKSSTKSDKSSLKEDKSSKDETLSRSKEVPAKSTKNAAKDEKKATNGHATVKEPVAAKVAEKPEQNITAVKSSENAPAIQPSIDITDSVNKLAVKDAVPGSQTRSSEAKLTAPATAKSQDVEKAVSKAPLEQVLTNGSTSASDSSLPGLLNEQFASLYSKLDTDKRVAEAAGSARQDAILRLVSSTLTDNVESTLHRIVNTSIEQQVVPALSSQVTAYLEKSLRSQLQESTQKEIKNSLPAAIKAGLKDALADRAVSQKIATDVSVELAKKIDGYVKAAVQSNVDQVRDVLSAQQNANHNALLKAVASSQQKSNDSAGLEKLLMESERRVTALLSTMQAQHDRLANEIASLRERVLDDKPKTVESVAVKEESPEVQRLTAMLNQGEFEQATIEWLQSTQQAELFDELFVRINPAYLQHVSPLVALSVSAAVTASFDSNIEKRLEWLGSVISNMNADNADITDVAPKILDVLVQRLQGAYMQIAEEAPANPEVLKKLATLNRQINETRRSFP